MEHNEGNSGLAQLIGNAEENGANTAVAEPPQIDTTRARPVRRQTKKTAAKGGKPAEPKKTTKKSTKKRTKKEEVNPSHKTLPDDVVSLTGKAIKLSVRCVLGIFKGYLAVDAGHREYRRFEIPSYLLALGVGSTAVGAAAAIQMPIYLAYTIGLSILGVSICWSMINSLTRRTAEQ